MELDREPLLDALKILKPALATKDLIEETTLIWFNGKQALASNDIGFGIAAPCKTEFKGGVRGSVLLALLEHTKVGRVSLDPDEEGNLIMKAGKATLKLPFIDLERMTIDLPRETKGTTFTVPNDLLGAFSKVAISIGSKAKNPEEMGITIVKQSDTHVFATNDATISWVKCKADIPIKDGKRYILPTIFVEQMLALSKKKKVELTLQKQNVYANIDNLVLFALPIGVDKPTDFVGTCEAIMKGVKPIPIPARLKFALARALALLDKQKEGHITLRVKHNILIVKTSSGLGDYTDKIALDKVHPNVTTIIDPKLVRQALTLCQNIFITDKVTVLTGGGDFTYVVAQFEGGK